MTEATDPIVVTVVVDASPANAFDAFTQDIAAWWPLDPYSMSGGVLTLEPWDGGRILETAADGTVHHWGGITDWRKASRVVIDWHVGRTPEEATRVSVDFEATDDGRTAVTLTQDGWDKLGDAALDMRTRNDAGWRDILGNHFAPHASRSTER